MKTLKRNNNIPIFTLFILLLTIGCEKETEYNLLSGQLIGYVILSDNDGNRPSDKSGVEIIVEGSDPQIKVLTNENGQFIIDNLKSGIYDIVFNKVGYCQHKVVSYQFVGGNKPATINYTQLYSLPTHQIDILEITDLGRQDAVEFMVSANVTNRTGSSPSYCRHYISNKPDVSYKNYISTDFKYPLYGRDELSFNLLIDTLKFPKGSKLYLIMYPASETFHYYTDINTGNKIYTSININNPSEVAEITIP